MPASSVSAFARVATLSGVEFHGVACFDQAMFSDAAFLDRMTCYGNLSLDRTRFAAAASLQDTECFGGLWCNGTVFEGRADVRGLEVHGRTWLVGASVAEDAAASAPSARRSDPQLWLPLAVVGSRLRLDPKRRRRVGKGAVTISELAARRPERRAHADPANCVHDAWARRARKRAPLPTLRRDSIWAKNALHSSRQGTRHAHHRLALPLVAAVDLRPLCRRTTYPRAEVNDRGGYTYYRQDGGDYILNSWAEWFDLDKQLEHMDGLGHEVDVVCSIGPFSVYFSDLPPEEGRDLAIAWNEEMAGAQRKYPGRLWASAAVPLIDTGDRHRGARRCGRAARTDGREPARQHRQRSPHRCRAARAVLCAGGAARHADVPASDRCDLRATCSKVTAARCI